MGRGCRAPDQVPPDITFQTKPQIALDQIRAACAAGLPRGIVLAAYGNDTDFRTGLTALDLIYAVGIQSSTTVWAPDRFRPNPGVARDGSGYAEMPIINRSVSSNWPRPCPLRRGGWWHGAKAPTRSCARALPACGCQRPTGMTSAPNCVLKSGS